MKCLHPDCDLPPISRGLCYKCYNNAKYLVNRGKTAWAKLEKAGKSLPKGKPGPKPSAKTEWFLT